MLWFLLLCLIFCRGGVQQDLRLLTSTMQHLMQECVFRFLKGVMDYVCDGSNYSAWTIRRIVVDTSDAEIGAIRGLAAASGLDIRARLCWFHVKYALVRYVLVDAFAFCCMDWCWCWVLVLCVCCAASHSCGVAFVALCVCTRRSPVA